MRAFSLTLALSSALALMVPLAFLSGDAPGRAADHLDPPLRTDPDRDTNPDFAADIADVYAWHTADRVVIAMTFAGPQVGRPPSYDRDVLYKINISNAGARQDPEFTIRIRFGQNGADNGVQFSNVPGAASPVIIGAVETDIVSGPVKVRAGLFEDPFLFDLLGFRATQSSGTLSMRNDRDFFKGKDDTTMIIDMPRSALENGTHPLDIWATAARFGGNI